MMSTVLTGVRLADSAAAVLSARPRPGYKGDLQRVTRAQGNEQVALPA